MKTRCAKLLGQLGEKIGAASPVACQDWAVAGFCIEVALCPRLPSGAASQLVTSEKPTEPQYESARFNAAGRIGRGLRF
ncbi:MAG: hypothetical protein KF752_07850 [Pirellulaceae bacterium]|nr:hypothetical protein [Pirellulaceae bacterium]